MRIAKKFDPSGTRTIGTMIFLKNLTVGVLTKADTVDKDERDRWLDILNGGATCGFYMTKLAFDKGLQKLKKSDAPEEATPEEIRKEEDKYFSKGRSPWAGAKDKRRLGTRNLLEALATTLGVMFRKRCRTLKIISNEYRLPSLKRDCADKFYALQKELINFPEPYTGREQEKLLELCNAFISDLEKQTECNSVHPDLFRRLKTISCDLQKQFTQTKPFFELPDNVDFSHPALAGYSERSHAAKSRAKNTQDSGVRGSRIQKEGKSHVWVILIFSHSIGGSKRDHLSTFASRAS
jgi:hypothetical protein